MLPLPEMKLFVRGGIINDTNLRLTPEVLVLKEEEYKTRRKILKKKILQAKDRCSRDLLENVNEEYKIMRNSLKIETPKIDLMAEMKRNITVTLFPQAVETAYDLSEGQTYGSIEEEEVVTAVRQGKARQGKARHGTARHGTARHGTGTGTGKRTRAKGQGQKDKGKRTRAKGQGQKDKGKRTRAKGQGQKDKGKRTRTKGQGQKDKDKDKDKTRGGHL